MAVSQRSAYDQTIATPVGYWLTGASNTCPSERSLLSVSGLSGAANVGSPHASIATARLTRRSVTSWHLRISSFAELRLSCPNPLTVRRVESVYSNTPSSKSLDLPDTNQGSLHSGSIMSRPLPETFRKRPESSIVATKSKHPGCHVRG